MLLAVEKGFGEAIRLEKGGGRRAKVARLHHRLAGRGRTAIELEKSERVEVGGARWKPTSIGVGRWYYGSM